VVPHNALNFIPIQLTLKIHADVARPALVRLVSCRSPVKSLRLTVADGAFVGLATAGSPVLTTFAGSVVMASNAGDFLTDTSAMYQSILQIS
jgi:hypothetical protein